MKTTMASGAPSTFRKLLEDRLARVVPDLESLVEAAAASARRSVSEHLNQAVRRLREAHDFEEAASVVLDASTGFCNGAAIFRVKHVNTIVGDRVRGLDGERAAIFSTVEFPASAGAAFAAAIQGNDPVVTLGNREQLSPAVADLFAHVAEQRVALFPIAPAGKMAGVLYAWGEPEMAALELLAQAAGLALAGARPAEPPPELVGIAPAGQPAKPAASGWAAMQPAEREAHLRAQRFARVQVAEIRLYRPEAVTAGRTRRDLYGALGESIEAARETFRRQFLIPTPGMVDYLHEELLRTLANDEPALLGEKYPGPLA